MSKENNLELLNRKSFHYKFDDVVKLYVCAFGIYITFSEEEASSEKFFDILITKYKNAIHAVTDNLEKEILILKELNDQES